MKKVLYIFMATILFGSACRKTGFGSIEGTVYETGSNEPISNIYVYLSWIDDHNKGSNKKVFTDASGHFKFRFYKSSEKKYNLYASSEEYYGMTDISSYDIEKRKTKHDIYMDPLSEIQFQIINNSSVSTHVEMDYQFSYNTKPNHDTLLPKRIKANGFGKTTIHYNIGSTQHIDNIYIYSKNSVYTHTITIN